MITPSKFVERKVFNMHDLDRELEDHLVAEHELRNDSYLRWYIGTDPDDPNAVSLDQWLIENGAKPEECVLIHVSW